MRSNRGPATSTWRARLALTLGAMLLAAVVGALLGALTDNGATGTPARSATVPPHHPAARTAASRPPGVGHVARVSATAPWIKAAGLRRRLDALAAVSGGSLGVVVRPIGAGPIFSWGPLQIGPAWSTMKVPVALARFRLADTDLAMSANDEELVRAAITESDNAAALALFSQIEVAQGGLIPASAYVQNILRSAGDDVTVVNTVVPAGGFSTFGQTKWSLERGAIFFAALARRCLAPSAADAALETLMREITPSQRWGLGEVPFPGAASLAFKGGWGPSPSGRYLVRQFGIVRTANARGVIIALAAAPADGAFASGVQMLNGLAGAIAEQVEVARSPAYQPCG